MENKKKVVCINKKGEVIKDLKKIVVPLNLNTKIFYETIKNYNYIDRV